MDVILSRMHLVMHSLGYDEVREEAGQRSMRLQRQLLHGREELNFFANKLTLRGVTRLFPSESFPTWRALT